MIGSINLTVVKILIDSRDKSIKNIPTKKSLRDSQSK